MKTDFNRFEPVWTGWFQFVLVGLSWNKFPACRFEIIFTLLYILKLRSSKFTWFLCPFDDLLSAAKLVNCISLCKLHLYPIRYDYFGWLLRTRDDVTSNTPFFSETPPFWVKKRLGTSFEGGGPRIDQCVVYYSIAGTFLIGFEQLIWDQSIESSVGALRQSITSLSMCKPVASSAQLN